MAIRAPFFPQLPAEALSAEEQLVAFSPQSEKRLKGVNPTLVDLMKEVEKRAQERGLDLEVTEGVRDLERQEELLEEGKSQTLASKHLVGNALDVHLRGPDGSAIWDFEAYQPVAEIAKEVAAEKGIDNLVWGGDWKTLKDGVHFELDAGSSEDATPDQRTEAAKRRQYAMGDTDPGSPAEIVQAYQEGLITEDEFRGFLEDKEKNKGPSFEGLMYAADLVQSMEPETNPAPSARSLDMRLSPGRASATPGTQAIGRFGLEGLLGGNPLLGIR